MKNLHPAIRIRLLLQFISSISTMAILPYIIIYFAEEVGKAVTGVLFLCVMLASVLGSLLGGFTSDRVGRRKVILLAELFVFIGYLGAAVANTSVGAYPYITFLFFMIIQFSTGVVNPAYQALIIDVSSPEERKIIYTYAYWVRNLGIAIGSMVGAFFFFSHLVLLLLSAALVSLLSILMTKVFIKETYQPNVQRQKSSQTIQVYKEYLNILKHKFFIIFILASVLIVAVEEQLTNYIGIRLKEQLPNPVQIITAIPMEVDGVNLLGFLKTENTILVVALTFVVITLIKRWKERVTFLVGLLLFFTGYTVLSFTTIPMLLIVAMFLVSIGEMMYIPMQQALLANSVPDHARSTYMSLYGVSIFLGVSAAGVVVIVSEWVPSLVITGVIALMGGLSFILFARLVSIEKKQEETNIINLKSVSR